MPISNFMACMGGDLSKVVRSKYFDSKKAKEKWAFLFNLHIKAHGLPPNYTAYVKRKAKAIHHYNLAYNKGKKWMLVKAHVYDAEANLILVGSGKSESIETTCARISKFMGFSVKANICSVTEFYSYVKLMGNG